MQIDLSGKAAIVTAGAAGIGRTIADQFIECGARVAVCDISRPDLDEFLSHHPDAHASEADVSSPEDVDHFVDAVEKEFGGLDILVNNAGVSGPTKSVDEIEPDEWARTLDVNLKGAFLFARRAALIFKAQKQGTIINIVSTAGRVGMPLRTPYSASKFGLRGFSDTLAIELGEYGVRVNAILPGFVDGPRGKRVIAEQAEAQGMSYDEYLPLFLHNISLHVAVSAEDVAAMAAFLASDFAKNVSGQSIGVCGNFESYRSPAMAP